MIWFYTGIMARVFRPNCREFEVAKMIARLDAMEILQNAYTRMSRHG